MPASFEAINYSLRVNKNVERKLLMEVIGALRPEFPIHDYQYLGFGSIWYIDFILAHKRLGILKLISVEKEMSRKDRAEFNLPFSCVDLMMGALGQVMPTLDFEKRTVAWLDYDDGLTGEGFADVASITQRLASGSILIVSANADRRQLDAPKIGKDQEAVLRYYAKDLVPTPLPTNWSSTTAFPVLVADILTANIEHSLNAAKRPEKYFPLFNFHYKDGVSMVTVGGMVANDQDMALVRAKNLAGKYPFAYSGQQFDIDVPHLTHKEKTAFDRLLPSRTPIKPNKLKYTLTDTHIRSYQQLYTYYPIFEELF
jgi:hypothetical protein